jgi:hypothetical protein
MHKYFLVFIFLYVVGVNIYTSLALVFQKYACSNTLKLNDTYDVVSKLKTLPIQNTSLQELYDNLNNETGDFIAKNNDLSNATYRALTIWQPIPPPGYVALGCIFVNSSSRVEKPSKDLIACVPKSCAKNFKRRTWIPEDLIFRYTDDTQSLAFYRNPYLGTVVVMNEKINNSEFFINN